MNMTFGRTEKNPLGRSIVVFGFVVSLLFVGFDSWPMPVLRADEPDSISPLVAESTAAIAVTDRQVSRYDFARTLFLADQRARAQKEFQAIWNDPSEGGPPRHCIAFYLAMIARADSNQSVAGGWFDRARSLATKDSRGHEDAAFYRAYQESSLYNESRRRDLMPGFSDPRIVMVSLAARQPASATAPDHVQSREVYQQLVVRARTAYEREKSIPNRINLASALLLHAEFAARSKESLYVTANDHFSEGRMLYEQVKEELVKDADAEKMIASTPRVAMRLDAVKVRFTAITTKAELSRGNERTRLQNLRKIVKHYRDVAGNLAMASTGLALEDHADGQATLEAAKREFAAIEEIIDLDNPAKDYYLLTDEPEDPDDSKIVYQMVDPFTKNYKSQLEALIATLAYRSATAGNDQPVVNKLDEAIKVANTSLETDGDNSLAHYILALAHEAKAVAQTSQNPASRQAHEKAKVDFDEAKKHFASAERLLTQGGAGKPKPATLVLALAAGEQRQQLLQNVLFVNQPPAKQSKQTVLAVVQRKQSELIDDAKLLVRGQTLMANGKATAAAVELRYGLARHESPDLWYAWAEAGLRSGRLEEEVLKDFDAARQEGILQADDYRTVLVRSKLVLASVLRKMAANPLEDLSNDERVNLKKTVENEIQLLELAKGKTNEEKAKLQIEAFKTLAHAYRVTVVGQADPTIPILDVYEIARKSDAALTELLKKTPGNIELQEAAIACRLARGYLGAAFLQPWALDPVNAYAAALDEHAKLPLGRPDAKMLGAPLIRALKRRPVDAGKTSVDAEQRLRRQLEDFVEGAISLYFEHPETAVQKMTDGLQRGKQAGPADPDRLLSAAELLGLDSGVHHSEYAQAMLGSFKVISLIAAKNPEEALVESIRLTLPKEPAVVFKQIRPDLVRQAVAAVRSPMAGFALGSSLEALVDKVGLEEFPDRTVYLEQANLALTRASKRLSKELRVRYPVIAELTDEAAERLQDPDFFANKAEDLRGKYRLEDAIEAMLAAVARHPRNSELWEELLKLAVAHADTVGGGKQVAEFDRARKLLDKMRLVSKATAYQQAYWEGYIRERQGNRVEAEKFYREAIEISEKQKAEAADPEDRNRVEARLIRTKARLAIVQLQTDEEKANE